MKLIKLTMQAFGPFAGRESIDFTQLGSHPLFLINGPTGAGKSSVLDAICFALYGQTTGAEREPSQMRCDHSGLSLLTEVSLEFTLGEKHYLIRRIPEQERAKSRGEGTTRLPPEAQLREIGHTIDRQDDRTADANRSDISSQSGRLIVSRSVTDATAEIKQLIGLGVEQFRQVMVLPQGKFRELLLADSKERESIFSQLFATKIYKKIENRLKEKAAGIKQTVSTHQDELRGILQGADVCSESELGQELAELRPKLDQAKSTRDKAEQQLKNIQREREQAIATKQRFDDLVVKERALSAKKAESKDVVSKESSLEKAQKVQSIFHLYTQHQSEAGKLITIVQHHGDAKSALLVAKDSHSKANEHFAKASQAAQEVDVLKRRQIDLQRYESLTSELKSAKQALIGATDKAAISKNNLEDKRLAIKALADELTQKEELTLQHAKDLEPLGGQQRELEKLTEILSERQKLTRVEQAVKTEIKQQAATQVALENKTKDFEFAKTHANRTELLWHNGQVKLLAAMLEDDKPCPVCGSKEHPAPAKSVTAEELVSKQQVVTARQMEDKAREEMLATREALAELDKHLDVLASQQNFLKDRLGQFADRTLKDINEEYQQLQNRCQTLLALKTEKASLDNRITGIKKALTEDQSLLSELEAKATEDNAEVIKSEDRAQQIEAQIPEAFREAKALENALAEIATTMSDLTRKQTMAEASLKEKQSELDQAISTEKTLLAQSKEQQVLTAKAENTWLAALGSSEFATAEQFLHARLSEVEQNTLKAEIDAYRAEVTSLQAIVSQLRLDLQAKERPNLLAIEQLLQEQTNQFTVLDNSWRKLEARAGLLLGVQKKIKNARSVYDQLAKQYAVIGTLSDVANGTTGNKISLQRFVLSVLLDDVLIQASRRLQLMSKGRYRLLRKEDRAKGNKASGLDLEVEDSHTGKPRSVATLSGGESFMAALSLALGLSDVVQSYAGGIKLDTLFIDEGFGSLDAESLDAAISVLTDLQATGRTIGIISHVSELKEQMALRIDVNSGRTGSTIATVSSMI